MKRKWKSVLILCGVILLIVGFIGYRAVSSDLDAARARIEAIEIKNENLLETEKRNLAAIKLKTEQIKAISAAKDKAVLDYRKGISEANKKISLYRDVVFYDLPECQENFGNLLIDYKKYIKGSTDKFDLTIKLHKAEITEYHNVIKLQDEDYASCNLRVDNLNEIVKINNTTIRNIKRKNFWRYIKGAGFGMLFTGLLMLFSGK
ncbi:MAG TPA: hypothetical protein VMW50_01785 [Dehalococcoidia bacterium]|nr:hypothetical protein [Dehalococcoidia bacterium]